MLVLTAVLASAAADVEALTFGGDITAVTDYIFRGISQNDGKPAAQLDLHVAANNGLFAGAWGSSLSRARTSFEWELYAGKRFDLSSSWSATLTAAEYNYAHNRRAHSNDYQELSLAFAYLDTLTVSLSASPNAVRYWHGYRLGRYAAYDVDVALQWPLFGPLLATGGVGYYYFSGPAPSAWGTQGYAYGNAGLALERGPWRVDVGYYFADSQAENLYPYAASNNRAAATLTWRF
jgi:uncharacterized protein (TIGR02001 family)